MNLQEIKKLLEKFYEGETTLEEEKRLQDFFASDNIPAGLKVFRDQFQYFSDQKEVSLTDREFDRRVMQDIRPQRSISGTAGRHFRIRLTIGIAAVVLLMFGIFTVFERYSGKIEDSYKDPKVAYIEARKIMLFVSNRLNKGTEQLDKVAKFQTGMNQLQEVSKFDDGIKEISKISQYDKINQVFNTTN